MNDLNLVIFVNRGCSVLRLWNDLLVKGHCKIRCLNIQLSNQIFKVLAFQDFPVFAINREFQENLSKIKGQALVRNSR
jgi:hypothetical protein